MGWASRSGRHNPTPAAVGVVVVFLATGFALLGLPGSGGFGWASPSRCRRGRGCCRGGVVGGGGGGGGGLRLVVVSRFAEKKNNNIN